MQAPNYSLVSLRMRPALPLLLLLLSLPPLSLLLLLLFPLLHLLSPALSPLLLLAAFKFVAGHASWFLTALARRSSVQL
jgi:hypothetical protein